MDYLIGLNEFIRGRHAAGLVLLLATLASHAATTHYVDLNSPNPVAPYTSWATAATNIQNAVSYAVSGDAVLVADGIYQYGAYNYQGNNRVYIPGNVTVSSVNGPATTLIQGYQVPGSTNGTAAIRCVYLSSGSTLSGFTLTNGATAVSASGGGVYGASTNCLVTNCIITGNAAYSMGGGAYYCTLVNCWVAGNVAAPASDTGTGGGAAYSVLINCLLTQNFAGYAGGAAAWSPLINCTVVGNAAATYDGALLSGYAKNSIIFYNFDYYTNANTGGGMSFSNCCLSFATNGLIGANNFTNPPGFASLATGDFHLGPGSPCVNAGNNSFVTCSNDLAGNPRIVNGTVDIGAYESSYDNQIHYASVASTNPMTPYTDWSIAATNIQDAVDVASDGQTVIVADGLYQFGGQTIIGSPTGGNASSNRVAITRKIALQSLNGPGVTWIQGVTPTGASAVRCAYLTNGASLSGFTLTNGAAGKGGGAWCASTNETITNCVFCGNQASSFGGGAFGGLLVNCVLTNNSAPSNASGGGAASNLLIGCTLANNTAGNNGGGAYASLLNAGVVSNNYAVNSGGGLYLGSAFNSLISSNRAYNGGGACSNTLTGCVLQNNYAGGNGGGAMDASLNACVVSNNYANVGGGLYFCPALNTFLLNNQAYNGGGAYSNTLTGCVLQNNYARNYGGGTYGSSLNACGVSNNAAGIYGGGLYLGSALDTLVSSNRANCGGGAYSSALTNSELQNNYALSGGGAYAASLNACVVSNNTSVTYGGGLYSGSACNTPISSNHANYGGGVYASTLSGCGLQNNYASQGGGSFLGSLTNCTLVSNSAAMGGGILDGQLNNCLLAGNSASSGGGAATDGSKVILNNCTICANWATNDSGGIYGAVFLTNCIVYDNIAPVGSNYSTSVSPSFSYCCTAPLPAQGAGNLAVDPQLVAPPNGDFHLQPDSPCINSGINLTVATTADLDGAPRIVGGTVDLGGYEYQSPGSVISYAWLQQYGLPTDGSADYLDGSGTGMNNWQKWVAGLDPTNPASVLAMSAVIAGSNGITVSWQSVSNRNYSLLRATDLTAFSILQSNLVGQAGTTSYTDTTATNGGPCFYRVEVP